MITIPKANDYLEVDFLKYANAILIQEDYVNKFRAVSTFDFPNESGLELIEQEENKPIFNPKKTYRILSEIVRNRNKFFKRS